MVELREKAGCLLGLNLQLNNLVMFRSAVGLLITLPLTEECESCQRLLFGASTGRADKLAFSLILNVTNETRRFLGRLLMDVVVTTGKPDVVRAPAIRELVGNPLHSVWIENILVVAVWAAAALIALSARKVKNVLVAQVDAALRMFGPARTRQIAVNDERASGDKGLSIVASDQRQVRQVIDTLRNRSTSRCDYTLARHSVWLGLRSF